MKSSRMAFFAVAACMNLTASQSASAQPAAPLGSTVSRWENLAVRTTGNSE